jgi:hypothetical protein
MKTSPDTIPIAIVNTVEQGPFHGVSYEELKAAFQRLVYFSNGEDEKMRQVRPVPNFAAALRQMLARQSANDRTH